MKPTQNILQHPEKLSLSKIFTPWRPQTINTTNLTVKDTCTVLGSSSIKGSLNVQGALTVNGSPAVGPIGATGATGPTGATSPTGATGATGVIAYGTAYNTAAQTVTTGNPVQFSHSDVSGGITFNGTDTFTVADTGFYTMSGSVVAAGTAPTAETVAISITINANDSTFQYFMAGFQSGGAFIVSGSYTFPLIAGDTIRLRCRALNGISIPAAAGVINASLSVIRLS